jgi:predicted lipoprotein with Yx(FWY)xxD motif
MAAPVRSLRPRFTWPVAGILGLSLALAACGSSSSKATTSPTTSSAPTTAAPASAPAAGAAASSSAASYTVSAASVPGLGSVLVNGNGRTLYLLTSEKGGKITCTTANGCAAYWPPVKLPAGVMAGVAGTGVQKSLLGTAKDTAGDTYVTYAGWPLYTFSGDSSSGMAHGQGVVSFGGTWWALSPAGMEVTTKVSSTAPSASSTTTGSGYSSGY